MYSRSTHRATLLYKTPKPGLYSTGKPHCYSERLRMKMGWPPLKTFPSHSTHTQRSTRTTTLKALVEVASIVLLLKPALVYVKMANYHKKRIRKVCMCCVTVTLTGDCVLDLLVQSRLQRCLIVHPRERGGWKVEGGLPHSG